MLGLAKLISSSLAGLSASGLSLYFVPKYFEDDSQPSTLIYKQRKSSADASISNFEESEETNLEYLRELDNKFQQVSKRLEGKKGEKYTSLQIIFRQADQTEETLQTLYRENKEYLEKLKDLGNKTFDKQKEKLEVESKLEELKYQISSMEKVGQVMKQWKANVSEIICAIDNDSQSPYCLQSSTPPSQTQATALTLTSGGGALHQKRQNKLVTNFNHLKQC